MSIPLPDDMFAGSILSELIAGLALMAMGVVGSRLWRLAERRRMSAIFGADTAKEVNIVLGVLFLPRSASGEYWMEKELSSDAREPIPFRGVPRMFAEADVAASTAVTESIGRIASVSAVLVPDTDANLDLEDPSVLIGSAISNEKVRELMVAHERNPSIATPLRMIVDRSNPDGSIFVSTSTGAEYPVTEDREYAAIVRMQCPDNSDRHVVVIAGQFANGTRLAAKFFQKKWKRCFKKGRNGAIISLDRAPGSNVYDVECWL